MREQAGDGGEECKSTGAMRLGSELGARESCSQQRCAASADMFQGGQGCVEFSQGKRVERRETQGEKESKPSVGGDKGGSEPP